MGDFRLKNLDKQIAELSPAKRALLERRRNAAAHPRPEALRPCAEGSSAPLSFAQERLWLIHQLDPNRYLYNVPRAVRLRGQLDEAALHRSLNAIIKRHAVLRTKFPVVEGEPRQVVVPSLPFEIEKSELDAIETHQREAEAMRLALEEYRKPFDLEHGPVLRARLIHLADDDHVLILVLHHIVSDGWTGGILFDELGALYNAFSQGKEPKFPPLPIQYADFAIWQRERMRGELLEAELAYWQEQLQGSASKLELPTDLPRSNDSGYRGATNSVLLSADLADKLKTLCRERGLTTFTALTAGLNLLLHKWTRESDFVVGTLSANRNLEEIEKLVGCFVNFLPLRTRVDPADSVLQLLEKTRSHVLGAYAHQDCPFEKIIEAVNPQRTLNANPLFNVGLQMQNFPEFAFRCESLDARFLELDTEVAFLDLRFLASESASGLQISCEYRTELFEADTVAELLKSYIHVLEQLTSNLELRISEFSISQGLTRQAQASAKRNRKQTIAIAASFTAEPVEAVLRFWMRELRINGEVEFAAYNQLFQELAAPDGLLGRNSDGFNVILLRIQDWLRFETRTLSSAELRATLEANVLDFSAALKNAAQRSRSPHLLILCPASQTVRLGESAEVFDDMERLLAAELENAAGIHLIRPAQLLEMYPLADYDDPYADEIGHVPYTQAMFTAVGTAIARRIYSLRSAPYKVIVLDCDNTLWKGVCGEDGPLGIEITTAHRALQEFLIRQRGAGMLLCLCSKNSEEDVNAVFAHNRAMRVTREHIAAARINWEAKSKNLVALAAELQLGLDSVVLIDDNPLECAEVEANCPEVLVLQLPANESDFPAFLRNLWALDHWKLTDADKKRAESYVHNAERDKLRRSAQTLDQFLSSLQLQINIRAMQPSELARVSQLTQRTNQFNFTTVRRSASEIDALIRSGAECLVVEVSDRFGEYGLVGAMIFSTELDKLVVDTFLLSCRVLGRKVEHAMLERLGAIAQERGLGFVSATYAPSAKNRPAFDFLRNIAKQFAQHCNGAITYCLPAEHAASVCTLGTLDSVPNTDVIEELAKPALFSRSVPENKVLARIARELNDIDCVQRAIEESNRKLGRASGTLKAASTPTQEILAGIWSQLLNVPRVSATDNFFALGGQSLLATQVVGRIRQTFKIELPLRVMFEAQTLAELASRVDAELKAGARDDSAPLVRIERSSAGQPLSFGQQRLWFLAQLEGPSPVYNLPLMFRIRGTLDMAALQKALNELVRRHETLRTNFVVECDQPVQVIADEAHVELERVELYNIPEISRETELQTLAHAEARSPFDLSQDPLVRAVLFGMNDDDHALLINVHHIVSDRWSMGIMSEELAGLYEAFTQGVPSRLPKLPIQYADYAAWQRKWLVGAHASEQLNYWKQRLDGAPAMLELPTDRPRPAVQTSRGATTTHLLPKELVDRLSSLSQRESATLFMTLLAAFQVLLARYSGQDDIVVGSPIANRTRAELEPLIGFFVNTLALRTDVSGNPSFRNLLGRVREVALGAYLHQSFPFEKLVEELQPERSLAYNPVFQVLFALQNAPMQALSLAGVQLERVPLYTNTSMFDMSWFAIEVADGLLLRAEYNSDLFNDETIRRMQGHYHVLLEVIAAHPEYVLSDLPMLSSEDQEKVLIEFNATDKQLAGSICIHTFFERQVEKTPSATALLAGERSVSYAELNTRANRLAHYLIERGAGPDVLVGIHMERTADLLAAVFGVLKSGSAYVPLDPNYPRERLQSILKDSGARLVLTQKSLLGTLEAQDVTFICVDADWDSIAQQSALNPEIKVAPEDLCYVLFTSGSTGRPKGVALEHRNASNFVRWALTLFSPEELSGVLFGTSLAFDMSTFEMFVTAGAGGTMILAENALELPFLPAREQVTLINTVPSVVRELLAMGGLSSSARTIVLAGEALPDSLARDIYSTGAVEKLYNMYGPTETGYSTFALVPRDGTITIGKPIANLQAYILDKYKNPVPVGVPGELFLAGDGVARGYYGRPDLTAQRFLPNPFASNRQSRMYATGDLCRWLPNGDIQYLGRLDHQVKIRGFRVELGEIESAISSIHGVRQCLVLAREDQPGDKRLVAYIVAANKEALSLDEVGKQLGQTLPDFMLPSAYVVLDLFPVTANGKINRKALPAPEKTTHAGEHLAPRNKVEEQVCQIWSEVLRAERVSIDDNFFHLGGHSLLAAQVISRIRNSMRVDLPLKSLFETPTVAGLATRIVAANRSSIPAIKRVPRDRVLPCSFAQQRVWFLDQLEPNNALWNIPWTLRITGELNAAAVENALNAIVERHESLRTTFTAIDGQPVQVIHPSLAVPFKVVDLRSVGHEDREYRARHLVIEEANHPFDLAHGPLIRSTLLKLDDRDHLLVINVHHIASDRWSMGVLSEELAALYQANMAGAQPRLPELPVQYADYAVWQRKWLTGAALEQQLAYWKAKLRGAPPLLEFPTDRPRLATESFRGEVESATIPKATSDKLSALAGKQSSTLFMVLLAGFQALLSRYSGQDDIVVGTAAANRNTPELENLIGFFINTLPLRTELAGDPRFLEMVERAKETSLGAFDHQELPFEKLVEELRPERSLSHNPLVQVFFVLQNAPMEDLQLTGLKLKPIESGLKTAKGDMYLSLLETADGLKARLEYNTDLFNAGTMQRLLKHYNVLLAAAASNPELRLSELPLLTEDEHQQIVSDWNATEVDLPAQTTVIDLFYSQAEKNPERIAVQFDESQLSYAELDRRSNQLANYLRERGVGPDVLVGLFLERSAELLVALLGIVKAGGAYVPLDPAYPKERISFILQDASAALVVTQQSLSSLLPPHSGMTVHIDSEWEEIARSSPSAPAHRSRQHDLVYVLYTSGSTGKPKGVQIEHRNLLNFALSMQRQPGIEANDVLVSVTTFSFDMVGFELYVPLIRGARIVLGSREDAMDGARLLRLMADSGVTVMQATPSTWRLLIDSGWKGTAGLKVLCGGEALPADLADQLVPRCAELWNMYGPTETTIWSSVYRVENSVTETAPVGKPIANTTFYVLDKNLRPVPVGVTGELCIGGEGVARGYFNRPELTAKKFIADPFSSKSGSRLYRTGDLAKYLPDGNVQYVGRSDFQVKVRGHRIELAEIEGVLAKDPAVHECVVIVREDTPGDKRLVAYIVPSAKASFNAAELRAWVRQNLPDYMVPSAFVSMDRMPLTPNGKLDRLHLPKPTYTGESETAVHSDRSPLDDLLAGIWAEVLKVEKVGPHDDFFQLGGHSLLATQMISRIREALHAEVPLRTIFEAPTIAKLAERLSVLTQPKLPALPPITPVARDQNLPLSFAQQRLWFLDQLEPENPLYNVAHIARLHGGLNVMALEAAINECIRRHESLRTTFSTVDDEPVQIIAPELRISIPLLDLRSTSETERIDEARRLTVQEIKQPFSLTRGPLLRTRLLRLADNDHVLVITTHHIISDRWSLGVLSQELASLYEAFLENKPSPLPDLPLQYADYAVWQRKVLTGERLSSQIEYWKKQLDGAPAVLALPTDRPRQDNASFWGAVCRKTLPLDLAENLRKFSRRQNATFFMTLLAVFQAILARSSGQDDVVIGTDVANRTRLETEKLIGFFVNVLPIRTRLNREATFLELLQQIREVSLGAFAHQDVPFEKLVEELRPERSLTHNPLVQVLFVMQNTPEGAQEFAGLKLSPLGVSSTSRFDLVLFINRPDEEPLATWMYNPNLFDSSRIEGMANSFEDMLAAVLAEPTIQLGTLFDLLSGQERDRREQDQKQFQQASLQKLKALRRTTSTRN